MEAYAYLVYGVPAMNVLTPLMVEEPRFDPKTGKPAKSAWLPAVRDVNAKVWGPDAFEEVAEECMHGRLRKAPGGWDRFTHAGDFMLRSLFGVQYLMLSEEDEPKAVVDPPAKVKAQVKKLLETFGSQHTPQIYVVTGLG